MSRTARPICDGLAPAGGERTYWHVQARSEFAGDLECAPGIRRPVDAHNDRGRKLEAAAWPACDQHPKGFVDDGCRRPAEDDSRDAGLAVTAHCYETCVLALCLSEKALGRVPVDKPRRDVGGCLLESAGERFPRPGLDLFENAARSPTGVHGEAAVGSGHEVQAAARRAQPLSLPEGLEPLGGLVDPTDDDIEDAHDDDCRGRSF
jgi:hypothetical protein